MTEPTDPPSSPWTRRYQMDGIRIVTLCLLGLLIVVVTALIVYLMGYVESQRRTNECYQALTADIRAWIDTAVDAGRQDRAAQRELLLREPGTPEDGRAALRRYVAQLDAADATRARNPVPDRRCT